MKYLKKFAPINEALNSHQTGKYKIAKLDNYGTYVVWDGETLNGFAMMNDGSPDFDVDENGNLSFNWFEVTAPESQEFLDEVNSRFGTNFRLEDFAGR